MAKIPSREIEHTLLSVDDIKVGDSTLGTRVIDNIKFRPLIYVDEQGTEKQLASFDIDHALITVSMTKNIVTTIAQGGAGEIIEYIGMSNYEVSIQGIILPAGFGAVYPQAHVKQFVKFCEVAETIQITSRYLNNYIGITDFVVMDYQLPQEEGRPYQQAFNLTLKEDRPFPVQLKADD